MGIEEEIWGELTSGKTPNELIEDGYKKPTVFFKKHVKLGPICIPCGNSTRMDGKRMACR
jgi:hypothetical protein